MNRFFKREVKLIVGEIDSGGLEIIDLRISSWLAKVSFLSYTKKGKILERRLVDILDENDVDRTTLTHYRYVPLS